MTVSGWLGVWSVRVHSNCAAIGSPSDTVRKRRKNSGRSSSGMAKRIWTLRPWVIKSAPTTNTKSLTALSRRSNHDLGKMVSRKSANRLYSTQPMRNAGGIKGLQTKGVQAQVLF
jgi:hypothetical protein